MLRSDEVITKKDWKGLAGMNIKMHVIHLYLWIQLSYVSAIFPKSTGPKAWSSILHRATGPNIQYDLFDFF